MDPFHYISLPDQKIHLTTLCVLILHCLLNVTVLKAHLMTYNQMQYITSAYEAGI